MSSCTTCAEDMIYKPTSFYIVDGAKDSHRLACTFIECTNGIEEGWHLSSTNKNIIDEALDNLGASTSYTFLSLRPTTEGGGSDGEEGLFGDDQPTLRQLPQLAPVTKGRDLIIRVFIGGDSSAQLEEFREAVKSVQHNFYSRHKIKVTEMAVREFKRNNWSPLERTLWMLDSDVHIHLSHPAQGDDNMDCQQMLYALKLLERHPGFPSGNVQYPKNLPYHSVDCFCRFSSPPRFYFYAGQERIL
jgi:hypothetical protein